MQAAPQSILIWIPHGPITESGIAMLLFAVLLPGGFVGMLLVVEPREFSVPILAFPFLATMGVSLAIPGIYFFRNGEPRMVGLRPEGIVIRFANRDVDLPWTSLAPNLLTFESWGLRLRYVRPGRSEHSLTVLSPPQARALLQFPYAPSWADPPEVLAKWGIRPLISAPP